MLAKIQISIPSPYFIQKVIISKKCYQSKGNYNNNKSKLRNYAVKCMKV